MLKIGHSITRPGRRSDDAPVTIKVAQELETVPGIPQHPHEVDFYSREYPLESAQIDTTATREWSWTVYTAEVTAHQKLYRKLNEPIVLASRTTGEIEPTAEPVPGKDITEEIKAKARELGFGEAGVTRYDKRYVFKSKRDWVKFPHAICLAYEQEYEPSQTAPSIEAEGPHHGTYRIMGAVGLALGDYIRSLGYYAQVHSPTDGTGAYIPMFVQAGLGQLGANGQLLSPHFGSRARIMLITTDALVTYDKPIDYGIHAFCSICQVCVNRCPGRALMREKVWWRGVQKHKLIYRRCRPVMAHYEGCAACMRVCPIQKYGMKTVMDHYTSTGQVLGKGTHDLEGYSLRELGYFGPGQLPSFDNEFFRFPQGRSEDALFDELKDGITSGQIPDDPHGDVVLRQFKKRVEKYLKIPEHQKGNQLEDTEGALEEG